MRVRFEMYKNGLGQGYQAKCDMTEKKAKKLFATLSNNLRCGWAELIAEEDYEGEYMSVIESFDHIEVAKSLTSLLG